MNDLQRGYSATDAVATEILALRPGACAIDAHGHKHPLRVRFSDDALPAPIWRTPLPTWTRANWLLEKLHHKYTNPLFWWQEAARAIHRAPLLAEVCEPFADSAMLELGCYGVHPSVGESFVLKTLAPQHWMRTLSIANDLRELSQEGLKNVAELLMAMKTDSWQEFPLRLSPVAIE